MISELTFENLIHQLSGGRDTKAGSIILQWTEIISADAKPTSIIPQ